MDVNFQSQGIRTLYFDFDGVFVDSVKTINQMYDEDFCYYPKYKKISSSDIKSWNFSELEYMNSELVDFYFNSKRYFDKAKPMNYEIMYSFFQNILDYYKVKIVTIGTYQNIRAKYDWIRKYFPILEEQKDIGNDFIIGLDSIRYGNKSSIDMSDGLFIDDNANNLRNSNAKIKICFGNITDYNKDCHFCRMMNWKILSNYILLNTSDIYKKLFKF